MILASQLVLGIAVPAGVAAAAMLLARGAAPSGRLPASAGFALATGYVAGHIGLRGVGSFPPVEAGQWLPYLALAAAGLGAADGLLARRAPPAPRLAGLALLLAEPALLLRARILHAWSATETVLHVAAAGFALAAVWVGIERTVAALPFRSGWVALFVTAAGSAAALAASGSLLLGLLGTALAAACAGAALVASLVTSRPVERGSTLAFVAILAGLLLAAHFYSELPAGSALLLVLAPLAPGLVPRRLAGERRPVLAHGLAAFVVAAAAVALAIASSPPVDSYY